MKKVKGNRFLIALGSNNSTELWKNLEALHEAVRRLQNIPGTVARLSQMWRTPAFPARSGPDFVNACAEFECGLEAEEMLAALHRIEAAMGRVREVRWGARVIDLDLLAEGARVAPDGEEVRRWIELPLEAQMREAPDQLILPHPRLQDRAFVLVPLAEIAPDWRHPLLGRTVAEMRDALDPEAVAEMRVLSAPGGARGA